jgi:hypothetical protein
MLCLTGGAGCAPRHYVRIAEGLTSASDAEPIRVAPRLFAAHQLVEACRTPIVVERLRVVPDELELTRDTSYELSSLTVLAINGADEAVPGIPVIIEVEDRAPPVLQLRSDDPDLNAGRVRAIAEGRFRMRIRTTCGLNPAEAIVDARVR